MNERAYIDPLDVRGIPPDLWARKIENWPLREKEGMRNVIPTPYLGSAIYISRNLLGRTVTIGTSPVLLVKEPYAFPCMILNPATSVGLTSIVSGYSGTVVAAGNSQSSSLGVAGYENAHFILNVTAITGTWDIYAQIYDSLNAAWADSQTLFSDLTATGQYYAYAATFGIGTDLAFKWDPTAAGSITFTLSTILKGGLGGSSSGLARVVYLGGAGVTTTSGFPLLEGNRETFVVGENVELWAISAESIDIKVFAL